MYISYLRVSTARQGLSQLGLNAQRDAVCRHIVAHGGDLSAEFIEVETGKGSNALKKRPQLLAALERARRERATLIVAKLDRLTRSARFLLELIDSAATVDVVFCDLPQIPSGPVGRFMITQLAAVAEFEAGMISQRTKAALAVAKSKGVKLGTNGSRLAVERKTEALKHALQTRSAIEDAQKLGCKTLREIAQHLSQQDVPTRDGGAWHPSTVARVLKRLSH